MASVFTVYVSQQLIPYNSSITNSPAKAPPSSSSSSSNSSSAAVAGAKGSSTTIISRHSKVRLIDCPLFYPTPLLLLLLFMSNQM